jgi:hypothetical protein
VTTGLPDPPNPLPALTDDHVVTVPAGSVLVRAHDVAGGHPRQFWQPRFFGPLPDKGRFDHHPPGPPADHEPEHGVIYVAGNDPVHPPGPLSGTASLPGNAVDAVLAELVQDDVELTITAGLTLTVFAVADDLQLLDVRSSWGQATRAGTHLSTAEHRLVQPWAWAIRDAYSDLHGIAYVPSTGGRAVAMALNESAAPVLQSSGVLLSRNFADPALLGVIEAAATRLRFAVTIV